MSSHKSTAIAPLVHEIRLESGLRIYVLQRDFAPTFTALYQFAVGSAHDPKSRSGIAHLLEHMMFKGTQRIGSMDAAKEEELMAQLSELWHQLQRELDRRDNPFDGGDEDVIAALRKQIDTITAEQKELIVANEYSELITRSGGAGMNATTSNDVTRYFVQLPTNQLELWFRLESQRLLEPVFREFYTERDVVLEERRLRTDNQPEGLAFEAIRRLLYTAHPYGTPVIGWPRDIERLTREDALAYFRTYYSPSNCVMVLVGDLDPAEVKTLAVRYLGKWKPQEIPHLHMTEEPMQRGVRRQVVEFDAEPHIRMAWATVPDGHPDHYPLQVLSSILGELTTSRLNQGMVVENRIASAVGSFHFAQKYGGSFNAVSRPRESHSLQEQEDAILAAIAEIQHDGVREQELDRAKISLEATRVRRQASNLSLAMDLGAAILSSDAPHYIDEYEVRIGAVTDREVRDVAERYLEASRRCVVEVRRPGDASGPQLNSTGEVAAESAPHVRAATPGERGARHSGGFEEMMSLIDGAPPVHIHVPEVGKDVERVVLENGITVFLKADRSLPSLTANLVFTGGSNSSPIEELARHQLAGSLLLEGGAGELDPAAVERRKEDLGLRQSLRLGNTACSAELWSLQRNFDDSLGLFADTLMRPRLDPERLDVLKGKHYELMRRRFDYPGWGIGYLAQKVLHGDHPRLGYQPSKAEIETLTPEVIGQTLDRYFGPENLYVTVVGNFERDELVAQLESQFRGWNRASQPERVWITRDPIVRPGVHMVEKELPQPAVRILQELPVDRRADDADHAALEILNRILGGSGFRSRLMERLRSDEGLTYGINSSLSHQGRPGVPGTFSVSYQTRADAVARSIDIVLEECEKIRQSPVSPQEVHEQIQAWRNHFIFRFENEAYAITRLMHHELDDRPYDRDQRVLEQVEKVTPAHVLRVAREILDPDKLSIAVFGSITPADAKLLDERMGLRVWERDEVFTGGF